MTTDLANAPSETPTFRSDVLRAGAEPAAVLAARRARRRRRWIARGAGAVAAVLVVAAIVVAARPAPIAAEVAVVRRGPLQVTIEEAGRTRVRDRYTVVAPLSGELARITLRAGDAVDRGAVVARIVPQAPALLDPRSRAEAAARVSAARSLLDQARTDVRRLEVASAHAREDAETSEKLAATGSIRRDEALHARLDATLRAQELTSARFAAETAAWDVEIASAALARYGDVAKGRDSFDVTSPIAGRVLKVAQPSAGMIAPATPLLEIGDPSDLEVVVDVLTEDAVATPPRAKVLLDRWGGATPLAAHVRLVEPSGFTRLSALGVEEQRVSVIVDFDGPPAEHAALGDGFRVEAHIVTWEAPDVVAVPASAVFRRGDGWATFVADGDRARLRAVETGRRSTNDVQIVSGLAAGERVVVHPSEKLADGVRIATP